MKTFLLSALTIYALGWSSVMLMWLWIEKNDPEFNIEDVDNPLKWRVFLGVSALTWPVTIPRMMMQQRKDHG